MRLTSIQVERFRNILDSTEIPIDPSITCLVGKNESGKTNVLQALATLKPARGSGEFSRLQYPTWLEKAHQRSGEFASAKPISATFELDDPDLTAVEDRFGSNVLATRQFTVSQDYANAVYYDVEVAEEAAVAAIAEASDYTPKATSLEDLRPEVSEASNQTRKVEGEDVPTDKAVKAKAALALLDQRFGDDDDNPVLAIGDFLFARTPSFFYFDEYAELRGRTRIEPLIEALRSGDTSDLDERQITALCLLQLGYANDELVDPSYETRSGEMQAVAADLTGRIRTYWRQNEFLRLRIDVEAVADQTPQGEQIIKRYLQLRVLDERHHHDNSLDVRSAGFRWFVSFLAAFSEFEQNSDVIVLLDEPALSLHARAQADFLRFVEERLAPTHQVLYTTHSPFMVEAGQLDRVRVVEDTGPDVGAVVRTQLMSHDPDTLSPLQGALGYDIAQNIFVGPDNLVVEGLSDYTYLTVMSEALRAAGRECLDPRWRVLPAGGAGTMPAAIALLGRELDVTVLVDGGSRPPQRLNQLVEEGILDGTRILMLGSVAGRRVADIEDLFSVDDYLTLYNATAPSEISAGDLEESDDRILARIERAAGKFNHNDPSNWLLANRADVIPTLHDETLERFEAVIHAINETLRS